MHVRGDCTCVWNSEGASASYRTKVKIVIFPACCLARLATGIEEAHMLESLNVYLYHLVSTYPLRRVAAKRQCNSCENRETYKANATTGEILSQHHYHSEEYDKYPEMVEEYVHQKPNSLAVDERYHL